MSETQFMDLTLKGQVKLEAGQDITCLDCKDSDLASFSLVGGEVYYCINIECNRFKSAIYKRIGCTLFVVRGYYPLLSPKFFCVNCHRFSYKNQRYLEECGFFDEGPDKTNHEVCLFRKG